MKGRSLLAGAVLAVAMAGAVPAVAAEGEQQMTHEQYDAYLKAFNAGDDSFADFYDDDVVFYHAPMFGTLRGKQAIIDFYRDIRTKIDETVTATTVVVDNDHGIMAAELSTRLVAKQPGVAMPSGDLNVGDAIISEGTVYYTLKNGKIAVIRGSKSGARKVPAGSVSNGN